MCVLLLSFAFLGPIRALSAAPPSLAFQPLYERQAASVASSAGSAGSAGEERKSLGSGSAVGSFSDASSGDSKSSAGPIGSSAAVVGSASGAAAESKASSAAATPTTAAVAVAASPAGAGGAGDKQQLAASQQQLALSQAIHASTPATTVRNVLVDTIVHQDGHVQRYLKEQVCAMLASSS